MAGITPIGVSSALAMLAIGMLASVAVRWRSKPKERVEKWEKAEIMKQFLALSYGSIDHHHDILPGWSCV